MGGYQECDHEVNISAYINYEGRTDSVPICLVLRGAAPVGCLPVNYRTFLTDAPDPSDNAEKEGKRLMWELQIPTLGHVIYNESFVIVPHMPLPICL